MKRLVAFIVSVALTATLSAAPSYRSSVRPLVYKYDGGSRAVCTVSQVEDWPQHWLGAGHCVHNGVWIEVAPGVQQYVSAVPTIDGHPVVVVFASVDSTDAAIFYTPGYDIVGIGLHPGEGRVKFADKLLVPGYRYAKDYIQAPAVVSRVKHVVDFDYADGIKARHGFEIRYPNDLTVDERPTFGNSGSPVLKDGRIVGIYIGGHFDEEIDGNDAGFVVPLEQVYKAMKGLH